LRRDERLLGAEQVEGELLAGERRSGRGRHRLDGRRGRGRRPLGGWAVDHHAHLRALAERSHDLYVAIAGSRRQRGEVAGQARADGRQRAGAVALRRPAARRVGGAGQDEALLGTGHRDVQDAALLARVGRA
jgi:hypothetical protein